MSYGPGIDGQEVVDMTVTASPRKPTLLQKERTFSLNFHSRGYVAQPHQGDPTQPAGLDQLVATGTHRVPVDAPRLDPGAATPFQGFADAEDQGGLTARLSTS